MACVQRNAFGPALIQRKLEAPMENPDTRKVYRSQAEIDEENKKIRRLQIMMSMVLSVLSQDPNLTLEEAIELVESSKRAALAMFPDKELAYDLIYRPRLQRVLNERFRIQ
jgi:hypothetical protein